MLSEGWIHWTSFRGSTSELDTRTLREWPGALGDSAHEGREHNFPAIEIKNNFDECRMSTEQVGRAESSGQRP